MDRKPGLILIALIGALSAAACGSFGPPPSCGETIGGTADEALFSQTFDGMQLVNADTGLPGPEGENGMGFISGERLQLNFQNKSAVSVRLCIQPRGPGVIALDLTQDLSAGDDSIAIGAIEPGTWVIRVIVDNTLVKNFPFEVR